MCPSFPSECTTFICRRGSPNRLHAHQVIRDEKLYRPKKQHTHIHISNCYFCYGKCLFNAFIPSNVYGQHTRENENIWLQKGTIKAINSLECINWIIHSWQIWKRNKSNTQNPSKNLERKRHYFHIICTLHINDCYTL